VSVGPTLVPTTTFETSLEKNNQPVQLDNTSFIAAKMSSPKPEPLTKSEFHSLTESLADLPGSTIDEIPTLKAPCPLDYGHHESKKVENLPCSTSDLFRIIPAEIIQKILSILDLQSLTDLRRVSWGVRALVDTVPPYKALMKYSRNTIRALLSTETAIYSTPQDIFDELCRQDCFICGDFGPLLDMFTGRRCCVDCVTYSQQLRSIEISSAEQLGLSESTIRKLRTVHTLATSESLIRKLDAQPRQKLVRYVEAKTVAVELGKARDLDSWECFMVTSPEHIRRFLPMMRFPTLDRRSGTFEMGVSCRACDLGRRFSRPGEEKKSKLFVHYTFSGYTEHFKHCRQSQINRDHAKLLAEIKSTTNDVMSRFEQVLRNIDYLADN
jgi:hypothetical protein